MPLHNDACIGLGRHFWRFFPKFAGTAENVLEYSILGVYQYCSNDKKIIEMERWSPIRNKLISSRAPLHEFRLARKATSNICATMGKAVLSIRTAQHCFHRFQKLDDLPHSGRALQIDMDLLKELIEQDPRLTTSCLPERPGCSHIPIETHLHQLGKTCKYESSLQLQRRVDGSMELITSIRNSTILLLVMRSACWILTMNTMVNGLALIKQM